MKSPVELIPIDFAKPWWRIIVDQKWLATLVLISVIIRDVFWAMVPFIRSYSRAKLI